MGPGVFIALELLQGACPDLFNPGVLPPDLLEKLAAGRWFYHRLSPRGFISLDQLRALDSPEEWLVRRARWQLEWNVLPALTPEQVQQLQPYLAMLDAPLDPPQLEECSGCRMCGGSSRAAAERALAACCARMAEAIVQGE